MNRAASRAVSRVVSRIVGRVVLAAVLLVPALALAANPRVELTTSQGNIVLELYPKAAPETVANFLRYVDDGFYDGTVFHRVINGFMIQGGGFDADLRQKDTRAPIKNEADSGLRNERGTIAMARTGDPHSATAQFFINLVSNRSLDHTDKTPRGWGYAVFGKVVEGMDTVERIATVPTGGGKLAGGPRVADVPRTPVVIEKARRLDAANDDNNDQQ